MGDPEKVAVDVEVSGHVQGVGYRWTCQAEAMRLGVRGWVRNDPAGTVSGHFEGEVAAVDELVDWCHEGPRGAHVSQVSVQPGTLEGYDRFTVSG